jgi:hypothetical protein
VLRIPGSGRAGKPLDRAANVVAGVAANAVVSGSGAAVTTALEIRTDSH